MAAPPTPAPRPTPLTRDSSFVLLWAGQSVSVFGSLVTRTALPFAAILVLHANAIEMALLAAVDVVPGLLFGLAAGAWIDRLSRRPILIAADLARAILLATIPAAAIAGVLRMELLYAVGFLAGVCTVFFDVACSSYLPSLVSRDRLLEANSKLAGTAAVAEAAAFGAYGWLVQWVTAPIAILVDAVTFLVSAVSLMLIRKPEPAPPPRAERKRLKSELAAGFAAIRDSPILRTLGGATMMNELSLGAGGAVVMLFVTRDLGFSPGILGMIFAAGGLSSLVASLLARTAERRMGSRGAMRAGLFFSGFALMLIVLARDSSLPAVLLLLAQQLIGDAGATVFSVNLVTLRQTTTPDHVLGRVHASLRVLGLAATLLGALAAGLIGQAFGLRAALITAAMIRISAALALFRGRAWK